MLTNACLDSMMFLYAGCSCTESHKAGFKFLSASLNKNCMVKKCMFGSSG